MTVVEVISWRGHCLVWVLYLKAAHTPKCTETCLL